MRDVPLECSNVFFRLQALDAQWTLPTYLRIALEYVESPIYRLLRLQSFTRWTNVSMRFFLIPEVTLFKDAPFRRVISKRRPQVFHMGPNLPLLALRKVVIGPVLRIRNDGVDLLLRVSFVLLDQRH